MRSSSSLHCFCPVVSTAGLLLCAVPKGFDCYANSAYSNTVDPNTCKSQHSFKVQEYLLALGQRIRELRLKKRWSQEGFADIVGVHRTWMGAVERGESNASFTNLVLISRALGVTLSQLLSGLEKKAEALRAAPAKDPKR